MIASATAAAQDVARISTSSAGSRAASATGASRLVAGPRPAGRCARERRLRANLQRRRRRNSRRRSELEASLDYLRAGDTPAVWRLDRLDRSLRHLVEVVDELEDRGDVTCRGPRQPAGEERVAKRGDLESPVEDFGGSARLPPATSIVVCVLIGPPRRIETSPKRSRRRCTCSISFVAATLGTTVLGCGTTRTPLQSRRTRRLLEESSPACRPR